MNANLKWESVSVCILYLTAHALSYLQLNEGMDMFSHDQKHGLLIRLALEAFLNVLPTLRGALLSQIT